MVMITHNKSDADCATLASVALLLIKMHVITPFKKNRGTDSVVPRLLTHSSGCNGEGLAESR